MKREDYMIRNSARWTRTLAVALTGVSRNTLKQHFRKLIELGHLSQQGSGRGAWYEIR